MSCYKRIYRDRDGNLYTKNTGICKPLGSSGGTGTGNTSVLTDNGDGTFSHNDGAGTIVTFTASQVEVGVTAAQIGAAAPAGKVFGVDPATGDLFYENAAGNWDAVPGVTVDQNLLNDDLVQDANRTHDFGGFRQVWNNLDQWLVNVQDSGISMNTTDGAGRLGQLSLNGIASLGSFIGAESSSFVAIEDSARMEAVNAGNVASFQIQEATVGASIGEPQLFARTAGVDDGTATNGQVLTLVDATTGEMEWATGAGDNIYTVDGTLTGNRTMEMAGNTLDIQNGGVSQWLLQPDFFGPGLPKLTFPGVIDPVMLVLSEYAGCPSTFVAAGQGGLYVSDGTDGFPQNDLIYKSDAGVCTNLLVAGSDYATANLTADADRTHVWATFNQTENFTSGEQNRVYTDGVTTTVRELSDFVRVSHDDPGVASTTVESSTGVATTVVRNIATGDRGEVATQTQESLLRYNDGTSGNQTVVRVAKDGPAGDAEVFIATNDVATNTATAGQVLTLIDPLTGKVEYTSVAGADYATANLTSDAVRTHTWNHSQTENFVNGGPHTRAFTAPFPGNDHTIVENLSGRNVTVNNGPFNAALENLSASDYDRNFTGGSSTSELDHSGDFFEVFTENVISSPNGKSSISLRSSEANGFKLLWESQNPILREVGVEGRDEAGAAELYVKTQGVAAASATNGQVLTLVDAATGRVEYTSAVGGDNYATADLVATGPHTHDWSAGNQTENFVSSNYEANFDGTGEFLVNAVNGASNQMALRITDAYSGSVFTNLSTGETATNRVGNFGTLQEYSSGAGRSSSIVVQQDEAIMRVAIPASTSAGTEAQIRVDNTVIEAGGSGPQIQLQTNGVDAGTASVGQVLTLTNSALGTCEWKDASVLKERVTYEQSAATPNGILNAFAASQSADWTTVRANQVGFSFASITYNATVADLSPGSGFIDVNNAVDVRIEAEVVFYSPGGAVDSTIIAQIVDINNNTVLAKTAVTINPINFAQNAILSYTGPVPAGGRIQIRSSNASNGNGYRTSSCSVDMQVL